MVTTVENSGQVDFLGYNILIAAVNTDSGIDEIVWQLIETSAFYDALVDPTEIEESQFDNRDYIEMPDDISVLEFMREQDAEWAYVVDDGIVTVYSRREFNDGIAERCHGELTKELINAHIDSTRAIIDDKIELIGQELYDLYIVEHDNMKMTLDSIEEYAV